MELWRNQGKSVKRVLGGLTAAFLVTVAMLLAFAFALLRLQWDDGKTEIGILAVYVLSCAVGGWFCGHRAEKRRFLWGLLVGLLYFALLTTVSALTGQTAGPALTESIPALLLCTAGGMLGGMIS